MDSNVPLINESANEMIYEINHMLNCGYEITGFVQPLEVLEKPWKLTLDFKGT